MAIRTIPGVNVQVIREIVPPLPSPSGILALVGVPEKSPPRLKHVDSFPAFKEVYGRSAAYTIPEARLAFQNGIFEVVVSPVKGGSNAFVILTDKDGNSVIRLEARAAGTWANDSLKVGVKNNGGSIDLTLKYLDKEENFKNLDLDYLGSDYLFDVINRQSDLVVATTPGHEVPVVASDLPFFTPTESKNSYRRLVDNNGNFVVELIARDSSAGTAANPMSVDVVSDTGTSTVTLNIKGMGKTEVFEGLDMDPRSDNYLAFKLDEESLLVTAVALPADPDTPVLPELTEAQLAGGDLPDTTDYESAINQLEKDSVIDIVMASTQNLDVLDDIKSIYSSVKSHCKSASQSGNNRIGIGGIPSSITENIVEIRNMASLFNSERFVLVAPDGVAGAVAGLIGGLDFFRSPTFKTLSGITVMSVDYSNSDLRQLITGNVLTVDFMEGRGFIIVKGIDTTSGQISVTRVADRAVRRVKAISDQFIGTLNSEDGRNALKQSIVGYFTQLEKDGAIVPSTDGKDPAFIVNVYSSQTDFAQGIVRVDIAIRPVRSIDFIYATILVKN